MYIRDAGFDRASEQLESLPYSVYVNGDEVYLNNSLMKDGNTFIQLREFCGKLNVDVNWVDPSHHTLPVPGGNLPSGINLTSPTFIYTDEVTDFYDTDKKVLCVEITSIYEKYKMSEDKTLSYAFDDEGLIITYISLNSSQLPVNYSAIFFLHLFIYK